MPGSPIFLQRRILGTSEEKQWRTTWILRAVYDESDYDSEEQREKGEPSDARNTREARIASIMDVLQEIEDEDLTLMIEARERRRAAKMKERPARLVKSSARKKPTGEDPTTHLPLDFLGVILLIYRHQVRVLQLLVIQIFLMLLLEGLCFQA